MTDRGEQQGGACSPVDATSPGETHAEAPSGTANHQEHARPGGSMLPPAAPPCDDARGEGSETPPTPAADALIRRHTRAGIILWGREIADMLAAHAELVVADLTCDECDHDVPIDQHDSILRVVLERVAMFGVDLAIDTVLVGDEDEDERP